MNEKIQSALEGILEKFKSGEIPEIVAFSAFPPVNIPAAKWSLLNRMIMHLAGTRDARGFQQWQQANRHVKKGAESFTIFAPRLAKKKDGEDEDYVLLGFLAVPVFRVEDTEGEPLDYQQMKLPEYPLREVAESWGISIKAIPKNQRFYGCYYQDRNQIDLASPEESVFFHELAHAGHKRIIAELKNEQDPIQEIIAELAAQALCQIVGKTSKHLGNSYRYIEGYAEKLKVSPHAACLRVLGEVEKVLNLILAPPERTEEAIGMR